MYERKFVVGIRKQFRNLFARSRIILPARSMVVRYFKIRRVFGEDGRTGGTYALLLLLLNRRRMDINVINDYGRKKRNAIIVQIFHERNFIHAYHI